MTQLFSEQEFQRAETIVYDAMQPTLQHVWPLLCERTGCEVWVKHENQTPTGAFKIRGGFTYMRLRKDAGKTGGIVSATRGNHGQSLATAGKRNGIPVTIFVPEGNSVEKNAAMRAQGAELIEAGTDFDDAAGLARNLAKERGLDMMPSFSTRACNGCINLWPRTVFSSGQ